MQENQANLQKGGVTNPDRLSHAGSPFAEGLARGFTHFSVHLTELTRDCTAVGRL